ncbi:hypothetical protein CQ12_13855 [Bradyrhizobium jicamae]|uniref:Uncharacterized protein n=1 Tax=Bradyrhizobium jicamae TaxID=280332 RepID=A0A0R3LVA3_9BRAD|nr:hypothetical protein [Bradyrhizobium jicamae]KRR09567.1 hypothetical protein CQ12_13855 [Bradyrhizobium jicamae]
MPNFHEPIIIDRAVPVYRALLLECERRRQELGWPMWKVDEISGVQEGHYAKCLHVDRASGRQAQWKTLHLIVSALWPEGFDLEVKPKAGGCLGAEDMRMKVWFAAADNDRVSRRELMRELGRRGAKARMLKLGKRERKKVARKASKIAAVKRSKAAAARAKLQSPASHLSALAPCVGNDQSPPAECS